MVIMQGLTKPRQMLVVKDTCMAAIEYFTEPGIYFIPTKPTCSLSMK